MNEERKAEILRSGFYGFVERWLRKRGLLEPQEIVHIQLAIRSYEVGSAETSIPLNWGKRATPKSRKDPTLFDSDWDKILGHTWKHEGDRLMLKMLRDRGNSVVTRAEVTATLGRANSYGVVDEERITNQLRKLGLGDLRLLRANNQYGEFAAFRLYMMV